MNLVYQHLGGCNNVQKRFHGLHTVIKNGLL